jgi:methionyl-tRNA formyltransferase
MKKTSEPIIFFGSGPVAAKSLQSLRERFVVKTVITKPLPPHHYEEAPVVNVAKANSMEIYYTRDRNELYELFTDVNITNEIRLGVLVDFGIIIPQAVLDCFELGIVNSHFSLLPEWRGADPITFAILSGQSVTGVSLMLIVKAMDEGPLLAQEPYRLGPDITTPQLTESLIKLSNDMLASTLPTYMSGEISPFAQDKGIPATYSRKLTKDDGQIDWNKDAKQLEREIRAFAGWPRSHASINDVQIIITKAHITDLLGEPGKVEMVDGLLVVHCAMRSLVIDRLKPAGKNEMSGSEFLRGHPII